MPGKKCIRCGQLKVYETPTGGKCTECGHIYDDRPGPGRGKRCYICGTSTVKNGKCTQCGRHFSE